MSDLGKQLEEGRAARRERARASVAALPVFDELARGVLDSRPRKPRAKRFSQRTVDRVSREIEVGCEDGLREFHGFVSEDDIAHDVAWSLILALAGSEHPDTIRAICNRFSVDAGAIDPRCDQPSGETR